MNSVEVSVIVPVFNKANTIVSDIKNIDRCMRETRWNYEIVVVVDGVPPDKPKDKTFARAKKLSSDNIIVVEYKVNKGKGYAVRYGMSRAKGKYIAFIDAGMDIHPHGISMILEHLRWYDADIIVGSKKHLASQVYYPWFRKLNSFIYHLMVKLLFGLRIKDTQTGLKVFKRNVISDVLPRLLVKRFAFDIEILAVAHHLGYKKIYEAPVKVNLEWKNSNFSSLPKYIKEISNILFDTIAVFYRLKIIHYYDDYNRQKWNYDDDLQMRVNTGELE